MSEYPPVPIPPTDLSAPFGPSVMFLVLCTILLSAAIVYSADVWPRGACSALF
jgi:hypothetical protein